MTLRDTTQRELRLSALRARLFGPASPASPITRRLVDELPGFRHEELDIRDAAFLDPRAARAVMTRHSAPGPALEMSNREREVLSLVAAGLSNKAIARRLEIAEGTGKTHLTNVYRQIGVDKRSQAALWARERNL